MSTILRLDHTRQYATTPLTAVLKMFPIADVVTPQQTYEPKSSSFSIANLTTSSSTPKVKENTLPVVKMETGVVPVTSSLVATKSSDLYTRCDINNEEDVLCSLMATPCHALERHIRALVEIAVTCDKVSTVKSALSRLLLLSSNVVKVETKLPKGSIALLLDWLHVIDPELQESPHQLRKMLLFARYEDQPVGIGLGGYSQAYLLGAFTQQANWKTLELTVRELLNAYDASLNSGGVLDFVWAVTRVPKLWQGRERRTPRHATTPLLMQLDPNHLQVLAQYILGEKCEHFSKIASDGKSVDGVPDRMSLLLQWYRDTDSLYSQLVLKLSKASAHPDDTSDRRANRSLLFQLYLRRPCVLSHIPTDAQAVLPSIAARCAEDKSDGESAADVAIHCLLTMICSPAPGRDFRKRLHDLDAAIRTLASTHHLLLLRHFHLIYNGLDGLAHLDLGVLKSNNHLEVLLIIIGILELLHPHIFSPHHNKSIKAVFDCYLDIFSKHGSPPDLTQIASRIIELMHAWLATDRPRALTYLVPKTELLKSLSQETKEWRSLAVAAASAPTLPADLPDTDPTLNAPALPSPNTVWLHGEAETITAKLTRAKSGDEQMDAWHQLQYLCSRAPPVLIVRRFMNFLCRGIHNPEEEIRNIAWNQISRALMHDPSLSAQFVPAVMHALQSPDCAVVRCACDHLPDVILTMHAAAPNILTAAFSAISSRVPSSLNNLTKSMTLLTLHTGA